MRVTEFIVIFDYSNTRLQYTVNTQLHFRFISKFHLTL